MQRRHELPAIPAGDDVARLRPPPTGAGLASCEVGAAHGGAGAPTEPRDAFITARLGVDAEDEISASQPVGLADACGRAVLAERLDGMRLGAVRQGWNVSDAVLAAFEAALAVLRRLGAEVVDVPQLASDADMAALAAAELEVLLCELKADSWPSLTLPSGWLHGLPLGLAVFGRGLERAYVAVRGGGLRAGEPPAEGAELPRDDWVAARALAGPPLRPFANMSMGLGTT